MGAVCQTTSQGKLCQSNPQCAQRMHRSCWKGSVSGVVCVAAGVLITMSMLLFLSIIIIVPEIVHNFSKDPINCDNLRHSPYRVSAIKRDQDVENFDHRDSDRVGGVEQERTSDTTPPDSLDPPNFVWTPDQNGMDPTISSDTHGGSNGVWNTDSKGAISTQERSVLLQRCACENGNSKEQHDDKFNAHATREDESDHRSKKLRILLGILTTASKVEKRNLLRLAYGVQSSQIAEVSVRFVIGAIANEWDETMVGMENATYGDIIVLRCKENLNEGKTFTYFSSLPEKGIEYDYVMKTDDDSYVRIENLAKHLMPLPRTDLYYGYILPCENENAHSWYMAGMGYLISWDLVEWIASSPVPRNNSLGTEDALVADWFNAAGKAKNRVNEKPLFYDHPDFGGRCAHDLVPDSILIHQLKTPQRWAQVLRFFERDRISRALPTLPSPVPSESNTFTPSM